MTYQLAAFGNDIMVEGIGIDAAMYQGIKATLPAVVQAQLIGWRQVASVTATGTRQTA